MPRLIILGSSNAIPSASAENTHLLLLAGERIVLIDTASNPVVRLQQAGVDPVRVTDLVLTHFHPDHTGGVPLLLMDMWLMGRRESLGLHGLAHTLDRVERSMEMYGWETWPDFFPIEFHRLREAELEPVFEDGDLRILSSPVKHFIPNVGLRIEFRRLGRVLAYSCDTEPCPADFRLAAGADVLLHEAAGAIPGHSSAAQAGEIAREAKAGALYLIHYPTGSYQEQGLEAQARSTFDGPVTLARDLMAIDFE